MKNFIKVIVTLLFLPFLIICVLIALIRLLVYFVFDTQNEMYKILILELDGFFKWMRK